MKKSLLLSLLTLLSPLHAAPFDEAAALLQSRKYPESAAAFAALPPDKGEPVYLQALALHRLHEVRARGQGRDSLHEGTKGTK